MPGENNQTFKKSRARPAHFQESKYCQITGIVHVTTHGLASVDFNRILSCNWPDSLPYSTYHCKLSGPVPQLGRPASCHPATNPFLARSRFCAHQNPSPYRTRLFSASLSLQNYNSHCNACTCSISIGIALLDCAHSKRRLKLIRISAPWRTNERRPAQPELGVQMVTIESRSGEEYPE